MENDKIFVAELYKALFMAGLVESKSDFAEKVGVHVATMSAAINGNEAYITKSLLKKIRSAFPQVNENWQLGETNNKITAIGKNSEATGTKTIYGGGEAIKMLVAEMAEQRKATSDIMQRQADQIDQLISLLAKK